jgi:hypothetical protein
MLFSTTKMLTSSSDDSKYSANHLVLSLILKRRETCSLVERLKRHHNRGGVLLGQQLESTISVFSTTKVNGLSVPVEVTDGLVHSSFAKPSY